MQRKYSIKGSLEKTFVSFFKKMKNALHYSGVQLNRRLVTNMPGKPLKGNAI